MKSSFPSHTSAASAVRVQQAAHSSLWGTVPRIIFWQVISAATQYNAASQRSVYEAGIYKVELDQSSSESASSSSSVLSLTDSDGWLTQSPMLSRPSGCPAPGSSWLLSVLADFIKAEERSQRQTDKGCSCRQRPHTEGGQGGEVAGAGVA